MTKNIFSLYAMQFLLALLTLPLFTVKAQAQFDLRYGVSQFRWEGVVDGTSYVRISRNRVFVETASGLPVQRQRFDFSDPLPQAPVRLELAVLDGRGRVQLVEGPQPRNNYTAVVRIDDRSGGRDFYRFELRWADRERDDDYRDPVRTDNVAWSGRVDGEAIIRLQGRTASVDNLNGQGVWGEQYRFSAPLPATPLIVSLVNARGRGEIVVVEQPTRRNGFTAAVRIRDYQSGASAYSFTLTWDRARRTIDRDPRDYEGNVGGGYGGNGQRGLRWVGRVDGRDVLYIRGNRVWFEHQAGAPIREDNARFYSALPAQNCELNVRKLQGRGQVVVLERPSAFNNYTAKLLLDDRDGGDDWYELELSW